MYHHFGDKRGLFAAVVDQIDSEMAEHSKAETLHTSDDLWQGLLLEGQSYIEKALNPEFQQIVFKDGPAVLGDPTHWPSQSKCLESTRVCVEQLLLEQRLKPVNALAAAVFLNGAAMNAAMWVAVSKNSEQLLPDALDAFNLLASGFLKD